MKANERGASEALSPIFRDMKWNCYSVGSDERMTRIRRDGSTSFRVFVSTRSGSWIPSRIKSFSWCTSFDAALEQLEREAGKRAWAIVRDNRENAPKQARLDN